MTADDAAIIRALENQRFDALVNQDFDTFAELAHHSLSYTHSNGALDTLTSYLDKCKSGYYVYHRIDHPIETITVVGDTAVVIGEMNADLTAGGVRKQLANRSLAVWTRADGIWKFLAYQPTVKQV
ncbi:nuclear transport factor 2 family protein [Streptomyces sp. NPDC007983]|uniref:nuclear transport factor 2 family protein n=1 Tax=Streptomyces sp. NPDC007983 TaxID=3364800 RepID=UPI0036EFDE44